MKEYEKESILQKEENGEIKIETEKTIFFFLQACLWKVQISSQIQTSMAETNIFKPFLGGNHCDFVDCMNETKSAKIQAHIVSFPVTWWSLKC